MLLAKAKYTQPITKDIYREQNVILRHFTSEDIDAFMDWASDDNVTKYMMWNSYTSRSEAENFISNIAQKHPWFRSICLDNTVIGSITLDKGKGKHNCKAELGYVIAKKYWGNGCATRAIKLATEMGFKDLEIERIEAYVDPANIGSQRALEKNGFIREGFLKNYVIQKGILKDRFIYSFLPSICVSD